MSVLALALKRLALSHGTVPKGCPNGTPERETARDALSCPNGTPPSTVPTGHVRDSGANGTPGTTGTLGTGGTAGTVSAGAWTEHIRNLPCPNDVSPERFERLRQGAVRFAADHASEALRLGWSFDELFALAEPFADASRQGAVWFIGDKTVVGMTAAAITLRTPSGSTQRLYRKSLQ